MKKSKKNLYIITGYSGSGKSTALRYIEELDYYCVDNLPAKLLPKLTSLLITNKNINNVAVVIDARGHEYLKDLEKEIEAIKQQFETKIVFLDCSLGTITKRYKESRLRHPVSLKGTIEEGFNKERELLTFLLQNSSKVINTSHMQIHDLKSEVHKYLLSEQKNGFEINLVSFGFKYGLPEEADVVIDVRFLVNPYFEPKLKNLNGKNKKIQKYIFDNKESSFFINKTVPYIDYLVNQYQNATKTYVTIAFGCTGGKHRSVAVVEKLFSLLKTKHKTSTLYHRDILKE